MPHLQKITKHLKKRMLARKRVILVLSVSSIILLSTLAIAVVVRQSATSLDIITQNKSHSTKNTDESATPQKAADESTHTTTDTSSENPVTTESKDQTKRTQPATTPAAPTTPTPPPFAISYVYLSQPLGYCGGGGDYYILQINDVNVGTTNSSGGQITYGFEVTGGIQDERNGYRQPGTIPAGTTSSSFNKMYWNDGGTPHIAHSQTIWAGHGPAAIRAVVYSPNTVYSQWFSIPAQAIGEKCS